MIEPEIDIHKEIHGKTLESMERIYADYNSERISLDTANYALSILSNAMIGLSDDRDIVEMMSELSAHLRVAMRNWNDGSVSYIYTKNASTVMIQVFALEYRVVFSYFKEGAMKRRVFEYDADFECRNAIEIMFARLIDSGYRKINWNDK